MNIPTYYVVFGAFFAAYLILAMFIYHAYLNYKVGKLRTQADITLIDKEEELLQKYGPYLHKEEVQGFAYGYASMWPCVIIAAILWYGVITPIGFLVKILNFSVKTTVDNVYPPRVKPNA